MAIKGELNPENKMA